MNTASGVLLKIEVRISQKRRAEGVEQRTRIEAPKGWVLGEGVSPSPAD